MTRTKKMACLRWIAVMAFVFAVMFALNARVARAAEVYTVKVEKGYLALRSDKAYDDSNIKGKLYTGDTVEVQDKSDQYYWYVYVPSLKDYGYVDKRYVVAASSNIWTVKVAKNYLALRSAKAFDYYNEIGKLYTGDTVEVRDNSDSQYWWVYSSKLNKEGYVNKDFLVQNTNTSGSGSSARETRTVSVATGWLALRSAAAYDARNEIGQLYSGDTVEVITKGGEYWWVYSPKLNKEGYVNSNYLIGGGSGSSGGDVYKTVSVATGWLALRSAPAYDVSNEIGQLYSGETVKVLDTSGGTYWWVYSTKLGREGYVNSAYLY